MSDKPYSFEFLLENQEKILQAATNGQLLDMLDDMRTFLCNQNLNFNAGLIAEAQRRLLNYDAQVGYQRDGDRL